MTTPSRRLLLVVVIVPLVAVAIGVGLILSWLPALPATIAVHWEFGGRPDGFAPPLVLAVLLGLVGLLVTAVFGTALLATAHERGLVRRQKVLAAAAPFTAVVLSVALAGTAAAQRIGETGSPASAPDVGLLLSAALGAGLLAGAAAWIVLPPAVEEERTELPQPRPLELAPGERAYWSRGVTPPPAFLGLAAAVVVLLIGVSVLVVGVTEGRGWAIVVVPVALLALLAGTAAWRVRVDTHGVEARSALGFPALRIPIGRIREARVVEVDPLADFGGWGLRLGAGKRLGIVLRPGPALEIVDAAGRSLVVTVPGAEQAAALVNGLRARARLDD